MIRIGIYDFFSDNKYYYYESENSSIQKPIDELELDIILVNSPSKSNDLQINNNLKPYLIDHNNPSNLDFKQEDFNKENANIIFKAHRKYDERRIAYSWNIFNALLSLHNLDSKESFNNLAKDLDNYLNYQKGIIKQKIGKNENQIVIPVYDNLSVEAQELLLSKFKNRNKTNLLWKSIAACLGIQDKFKDYNLKNDDEIIVIDRHRNNIIYTKISLVYDNNEKRLIPCHKSFKDSYEKINPEYYQIDNYYSKRTSISSYLEALYYPNEGKYPEFINGDWVFKDIKKEKNTYTLSECPFEDTSKVKLILIIDKSIKYTSLDIPVYYGNNTTVAKGSCVFSQLKAEGKIPYFDHCEGLHIVYQKSKECINTIEYSTLIEENDKAEGGKVIYGKVNNDLSIDKGSKFVLFLLRIGTKEENAPLKELKQDFDIDKLLTKWQLSLRPSMTPGQGRSKIVITCNNIENKDSKEDKPFTEVKLDWSKLEKSSVTVASLKANRKKAFPPPINLVSTYKTNTSSYRLKQEIENYLYGNCPFSFILNNPKWPYKNQNTIKRFQRSNYFGNEEGHRFPNIGINSKATIDKFLTKLAENSDNNLLAIAWTYQGRSQKYFNKVIDQTLIDASNLRLNGQQASLLVNLLEDTTDEDLIIVFKSCLKKFRKTIQGVNNWMRCIYQLLMYHEFVSSQKITNEECIEMMNYLIKIYKNAYLEEKPIIKNNALRAMLFLLKRREAFPQFCQKGAEDGLYYQIKSLLPSNERDINYSLVKTIIGFLDGDGSITGIPLD